MRGIIESVKQDKNGKIIGKIATEDGTKNIYGLLSANIEEGTEVEYEMASSKKTGYRYAKFLRFAMPTADSEKAAFSQQQLDKGILSDSIEDIGMSGIFLPDGCMTVSALNTMICSRIRNTSAFQNIWVQGEVTNYAGPRGHYYFHIKDENALIACCLWEYKAASALDFTLEKGQKVAIKGSLEFYDKKGTCSIDVDQMINIGDGNAKLKYIQLKEKLQREGLFDISHHKEIPEHAKKVGVVTSKDGQAIRDICKVARERNPYVQIVLYDVRVQGIQAVESIIQGIRCLDGEGLDVIIVGRGGGSDEELLIYDEELVVRAVFEAKTPIVSAVGHEGHRPLVDAVADARFATPTDAAQHVISDVMSDIKRVQDLSRQIYEKVCHSIEQRYLKLEKQKAELEKNSPEVRLKEKQNRLAVLRQSIGTRMEQIFSEKQHRCEILIANLDGLSPTAKLVRGFGYIAVKDRPITSIRDLSVEEEFSVLIHDGEISAKALALHPMEPASMDWESKNEK